MGATLAVDYIPFLLVNFFAAVATILFARRLHKRKKVFAVCGKVWLSTIPMIFAFNLAENRVFDFNFATDLIGTFAFLAITAILAVGLLPILESLFHVMTDMTLMEYMDPDTSFSDASALRPRALISTVLSSATSPRPLPARLAPMAFSAAFQPSITTLGNSLTPITSQKISSEDSTSISC